MVEVPKLMPWVRALDFGQAFYLTSDREQAAKWAKTSVLRRGEGLAIVSLYEVDDARLGALRVLRFDGPTARRLLPQCLRDQFAFKTEDALSCLSFKEAISI